LADRPAPAVPKCLAMLIMLLLLLLQSKTLITDQRQQGGFCPFDKLVVYAENNKNNYGVMWFK